MKCQNVAPNWSSARRGGRSCQFSQGLLFILTNVDAEDESVQWPVGIWVKPFVAMMDVMAIMEL